MSGVPRGALYGWPLAVWAHPGEAQALSKLTSRNANTCRASCAGSRAGGATSNAGSVLHIAIDWVATSIAAVRPAPLAAATVRWACKCFGIFSHGGGIVDLAHIPHQHAQAQCLDVCLHRWCRQELRQLHNSVGLTTTSVPSTPDRQVDTIGPQAAFLVIMV